MKISLFSLRRQRIEFVVFFISAMALVFGYGIAVGRWHLFPHAFVNSAIDSARDWKNNWRHLAGIQSKWLQPSERTERIIWRDPGRTWRGYTFFSGFHEGSWGAFLIDMEGNIVHEWPVSFDEMWQIAGNSSDLDAERIDLSIHGADLLPNGDAILNVNGGPLVRLDRCGNYIYAIDIGAHHSVDALEDGTAFVLSRWNATETRPDRPRLSPGPNGHYRDETIMRVSPEGEVLEEYSIIDTMYQSDLGGMLFLGRGFRSEVEDPLHANDVEYLDADMADAFSVFEAGDLMVSLREISSIAVLDGATRRIKWFMTGPFVGQHDPDFLPIGNVLLYDNRIAGPRPELGYSRVLEIDPVTREIVWQYAGTDEDPMYTGVGGRVQLLPNGNVLAVEPDGGRIIEIARNNGDDVVWQFVNLQEDGLAGQVFDGLRFAEDELRFVGQPCR